MEKQHKLKWILGLGLSAILIATLLGGAYLVPGLLRRVITAAASRQAIEQAPICTVSADEAYSSSLELLSDGRQAEAEDLIDSAIKRYRSDERIVFAKAVLERSRWNKDAAETWFRLLRRTAQSDYLKRAAELAVALDQHEAVADNMNELYFLSDTHPDDIYLLWLSGIQCREQDWDQQGKMRYEKLMPKFRVGPVLMHQTYGNILDDLGLYEQALPHRYMAVSMEAKTWSLAGLADTLQGLKKYEWACAVQAQLVRRQPNDFRYWDNWGDCLRFLGRYDEAAEKYRAALKLNPRKGYNWKQLGWCLGQVGNEEEMAYCYQKAVDLGHSRALVNLGWCYQYGHGVQVDPEKAFELYRKSTEQVDDFSYCFWRLASCYANGFGTEKNLELAYECYEKALAINPNDKDGLNGYAWELANGYDTSLHDYPRAVRLAERSVELGADRLSLSTLVLAYEKNGQIEDAIRAEKKLIERSSNDGLGTPAIQSEYLRLEHLEQKLSANQEKK